MEPNFECSFDIEDASFLIDYMPGRFFSDCFGKLSSALLEAQAKATMTGKATILITIVRS